ncbi:MAG: hypothetical protein HYV26_12715 [Candidatus Hydrogenedentes bacterium]|nr:hypothetical protein [Candidatus Hydrogenedentota bacterium]
MDDMDNDGLFAAEEAAGGTSPDGADSDEDGIHDGIDPSPQLASPGLRVTPLVTLQGDAAGRELKAVSIDVGPFPNLPWEIDYDRAALPWLVIHPLAGRGSGVSYLGIDPAAYPGQPGAGGSLVVRVEETGAATMKGGLQRGWPRRGGPYDASFGFRRKQPGDVAHRPRRGRIRLACTVSFPVHLISLRTKRSLVRWMHL